MTDSEIDRLADEYLSSLHAGDSPELDRIWELAAFDPELEATLHALHAALDEEDRLRDANVVEPTLADAVRTHLPSAEIIAPSTGPVTVGDVARELLRNITAGLPADAHALNERLLSATAAIPADLGFTKFVAWAEAQFGRASESYWDVFYSGLIKLELRSSTEREFQLAARAAPKPEDRR